MDMCSVFNVAQLIDVRTLKVSFVRVTLEMSQQKWFWKKTCKRWYAMQDNISAEWRLYKLSRNLYDFYMFMSDTFSKKQCNTCMLRI